MSNRPISTRPLTVDDFSGGMTDYPIGEQDTRKFKLGENLFIDENKELITRPGSRLLSEDNAFIDQRLRSIVELNDEVFVHSGRKFYKQTVGGLTDIASDSLFNAETLETDPASFTKWNDHLITANTRLSQTNRIFQDESGTERIETLGLPDFRLLGALELANVIKSLFNEHTQTDHTIVHPAVEILSPDATDFDSLLILANELKQNSTIHYDDAKNVSPSFHSATGGDFSHGLNDSLTTSSLIEDLKVLKERIVNHAEDLTAHGGGFSSGITNPVDAEELAPIITGTAGTENFIYTFHLEYTYKVDDVTYLERGTVQFVEANDLDDGTKTISNIPELFNSDDSKYNLAEVKIIIGRSIANQDFVYQLGSVDNGTTTFTDNITDEDLANNQGIYIEGGVLDDDQVPRAKYAEIVNDILVMANVKEEGIRRGNRVRFSKPNQPYSSPRDFFEDFESDVTGIGKAGDYPIIFEQDRVSRIEGRLNALGEGLLSKRTVSNKSGCISNESIVNIQEGCLFAADDGFYFTDGFQAFRISKSIRRTYKALLNKGNIKGVFDKDSNLVIWSAQSETNSTYNDILFVAHLNYRFSNEEGGSDVAFTTWSGGQEDNQNFSASALAYIDGSLLRGTQDGYLLRHIDRDPVDVVLNKGIDQSLLTTKTVRYDYIGLSLDFGLSSVKKWVPRYQVNANSESSLSLQIQSSNDNSGVFIDLKAVIDEGNLTWDDPTLIWGDSTLRWNFAPTISQWRRFSSEGGLRCQYKTIRLTNAFRSIDDSVSAGPATVDAANRTVTLNNFPARDWIFDIEEYFISFENDDFNNQFRILSVESGVLTVDDQFLRLVDNPAAEWRVQGYKKGELFDLIDYTIEWAPMTMSYQTFQGDSN